MNEDRRNLAVLSLNVANTNLFMLFLVCKLTGQIDWPWVWVLAPLWVPLIVAVLLVGWLLARALDARRPDWRNVDE